MRRVSNSEFEGLVEIQKDLARLSLQLREIVARSHYSRRQLAALLGVSKKRLKKLLRRGLAYHATYEQLVLLAWASNCQVEISLVKGRET